MKRLLDTNAYVAMRAGHVGVAEVIRDSEQILMSMVVVGELLYGFHAGSRMKRNLEELRAFVESPHVEVVQVSWTTADRYGRVAASLRRKGTPIPSNDIWIAAHALETGSDLVSLDDHFKAVNGLVWINPASESP